MPSKQRLVPRTFVSAPFSDRFGLRGKLRRVLHGKLPRHRTLLAYHPGPRWGQARRTLIGLSRLDEEPEARNDLVLIIPTIPNVLMVDSWFSSL